MNNIRMLILEGRERIEVKELLPKEVVMQRIILMQKMEFLQTFPQNFLRIPLEASIAVEMTMLTSPPDRHPISKSKLFLRPPFPPKEKLDLLEAHSEKFDKGKLAVDSNYTFSVCLWNCVSQPFFDSKPAKLSILIITVSQGIQLQNFPYFLDLLITVIICLFWVLGMFLLFGTLSPVCKSRITRWNIQFSFVPDRLVAPFPEGIWCKSMESTAGCLRIFQNSIIYKVNLMKLNPKHRSPEASPGAYPFRAMGQHKLTIILCLLLIPAES